MKGNILSNTIDRKKYIHKEIVCFKLFCSLSHICHLHSHCGKSCFIFVIIVFFSKAIPSAGGSEMSPVIKKVIFKDILQFIHKENDFLAYELLSCLVSQRPKNFLRSLALSLVKFAAKSVLIIMCTLKRCKLF